MSLILGKDLVSTDLSKTLRDMGITTTLLLEVGYKTGTRVECYRTKDDESNECDIVCQAYAPNILSEHLPTQIHYEGKELFLYEGNSHNQVHEAWYIGYKEKESNEVFFKRDGYNVANGYAELVIELSERGLLL